MLCAAASLLLAGCFEDYVAVQDASVTSDLASITASAEFLPGTGEDEKVVRIKSNRSWYAHLSDAQSPTPVTESVPWGSIDVKEHMNLTKLEDEVDITVTFNRNCSETAIDGVLDFYSEGKKFYSVPIRQEGAVYHLNASAEKTDVNCDSDKAGISVDCNTAWTAEIIEATATATLDVTEGFDPGTVTISFEENIDPENEKSAKVRFSAQSCEPVIIEFTQSKAIPYLKFLESNVYKVPASQTKASLTFQTNCPWTASLESATLSGVTLSATSGSAGENKIDIEFTNPGGDPRVVADALVKVQTAYDEKTATFTQRLPLVVIFNKANTEATPAYPAARGAQETLHAITRGDSTYELGFYQAYWKSASNGLCFCGQNTSDKTYGFVSFPAIDNLKPALVTLDIRQHTSNYKLNACIADPEGNRCSNAISANTLSGATKVDFVPGNNGAEIVSGVRYKLLSNANVNCFITKITLWYDE